MEAFKLGFEFGRGPGGTREPKQGNSGAFQPGHEHGVAQSERFIDELMVLLRNKGRPVDIHREV